MTARFTRLWTNLVVQRVTEWLSGKVYGIEPLDSTFGLDPEISRGQRTLNLLTHPSFLHFFFFFSSVSFIPFFKQEYLSSMFLSLHSLPQSILIHRQIPHSNNPAILHLSIQPNHSITTQQKWVKRRRTSTWSLLATSIGMIQLIPCQL